MPIYEFHCNKCDKDFEELVFADQDVTCPHCQGNNLEKLFSTFSHKSGSTYSSSKGSGCSTCGTHNCASCH